MPHRNQYVSTRSGDRIVSPSQTTTGSITFPVRTVRVPVGNHGHRPVRPERSRGRAQEGAQPLHRGVRRLRREVPPHQAEVVLSISRLRPVIHEVVLNCQLHAVHEMKHEGPRQILGLCLLGEPELRASEARWYVGYPNSVA